MRIVMVVLMAVISVSCLAQQPDAPKPRNKPEDESNWLSLMIAGQAGGSWQSGAGPGAYAGIKFGSAFAFDLGFDRAQSRNGFSVELSPMLPVLRYPRRGDNSARNYLRIYALPGIGYRIGGTGGYASAKMMFALLSDERIESCEVKWSPYVEVQHRFPANGLLSNGDTRISLGLMWASCNHCGDC